MSAEEPSSQSKYVMYCRALLPVMLALGTARAEPPTGFISLSNDRVGVARLLPQTQESGAIEFLVDEALTLRVEILSNVADLATAIDYPGGPAPLGPATVHSLGGWYRDFEIPEDPDETCSFLQTTCEPGFHYVYELPSQGAGVYAVSFTATGEFALVDDSAWEIDSEPVTDCLYSTGTESPFSEEGFQLEYNGRAVPVAGASAVALRVAPESAVVNVLSADGVRPIPFLGVRSFAGQHYHELFSEVDGRRIGPSVKIGVGASRSSPVVMCWTLHEEYVLYYDLAGDLDIYNLCVVPVGDTLREAGLKIEPTDDLGRVTAMNSTYARGE